MPDAPELILRRTLAQLLDDLELAVHQPSGTLPPRGIRLDGVMPTIDEFTMLTSPATAYDGRVDALYRVQFYTRRTGGPTVVEKWANDLNSVLDNAEYTPAILGISLAREASRLYFDPDSQNRSAVACTYTFRGRRP